MDGEEAVQPTPEGLRRWRRSDDAGHKGLLPGPEPAGRYVPAGDRRVRRRQVPADRLGGRAAPGVRRGPRQRGVRAVPNGVVPERSGRVAQVRQVQQVPVHAEPGGRGQRQV